MPISPAFLKNLKKNAKASTSEASASEASETEASESSASVAPKANVSASASVPKKGDKGKGKFAGLAAWAKK